MHEPFPVPVLGFVKAEAPRCKECGTVVVGEAHSWSDAEGVVWHFCREHCAICADTLGDAS